MSTKNIQQCSGDELVEAIGRVRALMVKAGGDKPERLAVHPDDWAIMEPKLIDFCERELAPNVPAYNVLPSILGMAIYVTDEMPVNNLNIGPWHEWEIARRRSTLRGR